jgi:hypothetical protein
MSSNASNGPMLKAAGLWAKTLPADERAIPVRTDHAAVPPLSCW